MIEKLNKIHVMIFLCLLHSCGGYQIVKEQNPLRHYDVTSISVPMFFNRSIIPNANTIFTQKIKEVLNDYSKLAVKNGFDPSADALLIGIIESGRKRDSVFRPNGFQFIEDDLGGRPGFFVANRTQYQFNLRFILLKRPTAQDIKLAEQEEFKELIDSNPKVLFNELIPIVQSFQREFNSTASVDFGGIVNSTKDQQIFEASLEQAAAAAATQFKQRILDVF